MFGHLNDPSPPQPGPEDREAVIRRAQSIKRHRQIAAGVAASALVVLVAVPALALTGGDGGHRKVNTIGAPTTSAETVPETVVVPETTTTTEPTTTTMRPSTTTTALVCRNSFNPKCGPFRWDPQPVNQPMTATVTYSPQNPKTGETVTFHLTAADPDADVSAPDPASCGSSFSANSPNWGDRSIREPCGHGDVVCDASPTGPWTPPAPKPGQIAQDYTHVYEDPGTFVTSFTPVSFTP